MIVSLTFLRLMTCLIEQKWCKVKVFLLQSMSNAMMRINKMFAVKKSDISCLAVTRSLGIG